LDASLRMSARVLSTTRPSVFHIDVF